MRRFSALFLSLVVAGPLLGQPSQAPPEFGVIVEFRNPPLAELSGRDVRAAMVDYQGGKVSGALLGALVMASLDNGMSLLSVENATQYIIKGAVLVAAVGFDMAGRRKS